MSMFAKRGRCPLLKTPIIGNIWDNSYNGVPSPAEVYNNWVRYKAGEYNLASLRGESGEKIIHATEFLTVLNMIYDNPFGPTTDKLARDIVNDVKYAFTRKEY